MHGRRGRIPSVPLTAALQIGDIWLVMCPPTPPCGLSPICSQLEKEAESREKQSKGERSVKFGVENASKLIFLNALKASSKEVLAPSVCRGCKAEGGVSSVRFTHQTPESSRDGGLSSIFGS